MCIVSLVAYPTFIKMSLLCPRISPRSSYALQSPRSTRSIRSLITQATKTRPRVGYGDSGNGRDGRDAGYGGRDDAADDRDRCPVFELMSSKQGITPVDEVRDIYELCQEVQQPHCRESIYLINNLHMKSVETYLQTVQYYERCLNKPSYSVGRAKKRHQK